MKNQLKGLNKAKIDSVLGGFTLVELVVVVTILAILGVIAFITLQGFAGEARDSKRLHDVQSLFSKANIEMTKGTSLRDLIKGDCEIYTELENNNLVINGVPNTPGKEGCINFANIKESRENFLDPLTKKDYPFAYSQGFVTLASQDTDNNFFIPKAEASSYEVPFYFMQLATISEVKRTTKLVGNYFKYQPEDSPSLFVNDPSGTPELQTYYEDNGKDMIYDSIPDDTINNGGNNVYEEAPSVIGCSNDGATDESLFIFDETTQTIEGYIYSDDQVLDEAYERTKTIKKGYCYSDTYYIPIIVDDEEECSTTYNGEYYDDTEDFTYYNRPKEVTIPCNINGKDVKYIGENAFYGRGLEKVVVGSFIERIGEGAFSNNNINNIVVGAKIIGNNAFAYQEPAEDNEKYIYGYESYYTYNDKFGKEHYIDKNYYPIDLTIAGSTEEIGSMAFYGNFFSSIKIGDGVKTIGDYSFYAENYSDGEASLCVDGFSLKIPDSVTSIGDYAFYGQPTSKLDLNAREVKDSAFKSNKLENLTIGGNVQSIGNYAFSMQRCVETKKYIRMEWDQVYSKFLKKVTIPASVETWGVGVFANNILEDITIEDGVSRITNEMFTSQHTFDYEEFFETTLKSITIPASVTEIWENAFSSNGLEKIVFKGTPIIKSSAFGDQQDVEFVFKKYYEECVKEDYEENCEEQWPDKEYGYYDSLENKESLKNICGPENLKQDYYKLDNYSQSDYFNFIINWDDYDEPRIETIWETENCD